MEKQINEIPDGKKEKKHRLVPTLVGLFVLAFVILSFSGETYLGAFLTYSFVFLFGAAFPAVLLALAFLAILWIVQGRLSLPGNLLQKIGGIGLLVVLISLCGYSYVLSLPDRALADFTPLYLESLSSFSTSPVEVQNYSACTALGGGFLGNGIFVLFSSFLGGGGTTALLAVLALIFALLLSYRLLWDALSLARQKRKEHVRYSSPYQQEGEKGEQEYILVRESQKSVMNIDPELTKPFFDGFSRGEEGTAPTRENVEREEPEPAPSHAEAEEDYLRPLASALERESTPAVAQPPLSPEKEGVPSASLPKEEPDLPDFLSHPRRKQEKDDRESFPPSSKTEEEHLLRELRPLKTAPVVEEAPPELTTERAPLPKVRPFVPETREERRSDFAPLPQPQNVPPAPSFRPSPDRIALDSELERRASQRAHEFSTSYRQDGATFDIAEEGTPSVTELLNPLEKQAKLVSEKKKVESTLHEYAVDSVVEEKKEEESEVNAKVEEQLLEQQYFEAKRRKREEEERRKEEEEARKKAEVYRYVSPEEKSYDYPLPDDSLLEERDDSDKLIINNQAAQEKAKIINRVFDEFHIQGKAISFTIGASVTRFNIQMEPGVKSDRINSVLNELQIALNGDKSVRIETVVEGRTTSGIEIGNAKSMAVPFKEAFQEVEGHPDQNLLLPIGKDISGKIITFPLDDMPHLLVAGTTGSGKSVLVHSLIMTLLMRNYPSQLKLMLIDPKQVEFAKYNLESHLFCPVISDAQSAIVALEKLCQEMDRRYGVLSRYSCVKVQEYRAKRKGHEDEMEPMPTIVCVIDEFADLMQTGGAEVADSVQRISQKARACGIHLIIATQRPSKDVIPMVIKSNIACRIGLSCSTAVDSRVILDEGGAETLLGKGDLLFKCPGSKSLIRAQSPFISSTDIENILDYIKSHAGAPNYAPEFLELEVENEDHLSKSEAEYDLYEEVKDFVMTTGIVSKSALIRNFSVSYAKADQFLAKLRQEGIIRMDFGGKYVVSKRRSMED